MFKADISHEIQFLIEGIYNTNHMDLSPCQSHILNEIWERWWSTELGTQECSAGSHVNGLKESKSQKNQ